MRQPLNVTVMLRRFDELWGDAYHLSQRFDDLAAA